MSSNCRSDIMIWSHGSHHRPIKHEVHHSEVHEEHVTHKVQKCPLERCHGAEEAADYRLGELDNNLY